VPADPASRIAAIASDHAEDQIRRAAPAIDLLSHRIWIDRVDLSALGIDAEPDAVNAAYRSQGLCGPRPETFDRTAGFALLGDALQALAFDVLARGALPAERRVAMLAELARAAQAAGSRLIVRTGAVSMGVHDFVPGALRSLQADIVFHKLAMRPGKPTLFAVLPSGALLFGLPGNPMSSACGLRFFVQAALRAMQGRLAERPRHAVLTHALDKKPGWTLLQRATLDSGDDGVLRVAVAPDQESFRLLPFAQADVWALLPPEADYLPAGGVLDVYPVDADAGA